MSARDRWTQNLQCPTCGKVGSANVSENDHAYAPPERRIDKLSDGFRERPASNFLKYEIVCSDCEAVAG